MLQGHTYEFGKAIAFVTQLPARHASVAVEVIGAGC